MGRDQFYVLLDEAGLKLRRKRRKPRTTDSTHGLPTYPSPAWDFLPPAPTQLWAANITYIELRPSPGHTRFAYLALILDCYTEEIVGLGAGRHAGDHASHRGPAHGPAALAPAH